MNFDPLGGKINCTSIGKFLSFLILIFSQSCEKRVQKKYFPNFILILSHLDPNSWIRLFLWIRAGSMEKTLGLALFCIISRRDQVYPDLSMNLQTCVLALVNLELRLGLGIRDLIHHSTLFDCLIAGLIVRFKKTLELVLVNLDLRLSFEIRDLIHHLTLFY